jgi:glycosyltransferase involved in cell wall biosynthesis
MWECVAAGLPIVVNANIRGGRHLVVPGVTGELAAPEDFRAVMVRVLADRDRYRPREYFMAHWNPRTILERYVAFFQRMGWRPPSRGTGPVQVSAS